MRGFPKTGKKQSRERRSHVTPKSFQGGGGKQAFFERTEGKGWGGKKEKTSS